jgi:hypothetical protein
MLHSSLAIHATPRLVEAHLPRNQSPVYGGPSAADHPAQCCQVIPAKHVLNVTNNKVYDSFEVFWPFKSPR